MSAVDLDPPDYQLDPAGPVPRVVAREGATVRVRRDGVTVTSGPAPDPVNHPPHYTSHPSGIECIEVTEHLSFCVGNAVKYLWRADLKNGLEDLRKAEWYVRREIERRERLELAARVDAERAVCDSLTGNPVLAVPRDADESEVKR